MDVSENTNQSTTPQEGKFDDLDNVTSEILLKILAEEGNGNCFDCGKSAIQERSLFNF